MKASVFSGLALISFLAWSAAVRAEQLTLNQLPSAVQRTANTETRNGPIQKIQRLTHNGRTIYEVTFQQPNGTAKNIYLEESGAYVQDQSFQPAKQKRQVELSQVPEPVRREINTELSNGPVKRIEQTPYNGREIYEVAFQKTDGTEKVIYLNNDGTYVQDKPAVANSGAVVSNRGIGTQAIGSRAPLSGATKVTFNELPSAVQKVLKAEAGNATIEDIDKGTLGGKTVYEAAFKQNGQTVELRLDDTGKILQDIEDQNIVSRGPLPGATPVALNEVPKTVRDAFRKQTGQVALEEVQKGTLNGRIVYQGTYRQNGQLMQVRVSENGRVFQPPTAATLNAGGIP